MSSQYLKSIIRLYNLIISLGVCMINLILEAKWGSREWELLGVADKHDIEKVNLLYQLLDDWNNAYPDNSEIEFRIREAVDEGRGSS